MALVLYVLGSLNATSSEPAGPQLTVHTNPAGTTPHKPTTRPATALGVNLAPAAPRTAAQIHLAQVLNGALNAGGPDDGAIVYDLDQHDDAFARRATAAHPPASVEKLYTTVALMRVLGPDTRLHTSVLGTGRLVGGVWHGNLYLRGGGDPTFGDAGFNRVWTNGEGANASQLVAQLVRDRIHRVTGVVYADESLFDTKRGGLMTDYAPDTPDFGGQLSALDYDHGSALTHLSPARFAVKEFVLTMRGSGIQATPGPHTRRTPSGARLLASVASPTLAQMVRLMDVPSDDLYAELLTKQLGVLFGGGGTISDGARVIRGTIDADFGLHPTILDGSGLSRHDRSSPADVVDMLRDIWHTQLGSELMAALPTVGVDGTVQGIGLKTPARGRCLAKTGTLDNVTNLAGYCHTVTGRHLAFALMMDGPPNYDAVVLESRMIGAIAGY